MLAVKVISSSTIIWESLQNARQLVRGHLDLILPLFFVGFFLAAVIALRFQQKKFVVQTYLTGLFVLILLVNLFGVTVVPLTHWQKFSQEYDAEQTEYEIRVVDENGKELHYDHRATLSVDGVTIFILQQELVGGLSRAEKVKRSQFLLERANAYREQVRSRSPLHYLRFPPHGLDNMWTPTRLDGYSEFVGIRVYRFDIVTEENGTEFSSVSKTLVWEYTSDDRGERMRATKDMTTPSTPSYGYEEISDIH